MGYASLLSRIFLITHTHFLEGTLNLVSCFLFLWAFARIEITLYIDFHPGGKRQIMQGVARCIIRQGLPGLF